jgi:hypothetical protein
MNLGDLVHLPEGAEGNLGIVIGFDKDQDPLVDWILQANHWLIGNQASYEYAEDLIIVSGGEDEL